MKLKTNIFLVFLFVVLTTSACSSQVSPTNPSSPVSISTSTEKPLSLSSTFPQPAATHTVTPIPADYPTNIGDYAVFTYFFYWYDSQTKEHLGPHGPSSIDNPLTDEPPTTPEITWRGTNWFASQIEDMLYAGVDVMLPVYWKGDCCEWWSREGIKNLGKALEEVRLSGKTPPSVAMFYDTTSAANLNLTTEVDQQSFYEDISFFYRAIPDYYWAKTTDSRPIIWFFISRYFKEYDQSFIDSIYNRFESEFGVRPYLVFESSWDYPVALINGVSTKEESQPLLQYDAVYTWGGAISPKITVDIASVGPGYDERWIISRNSQFVVDRDDGNLFKKGWQQANACGTSWVVIETWNEYHEASEIAESKQHGRQYLDMSHELSAYFKQGLLPPDFKLLTKFADSSSISYAIDYTVHENGISLLSSIGDGLYESGSAGGEPGIKMKINNSTEAGYLYFKVDDGYYFGVPQKIEITLKYFDQGSGPIGLEYDSAPCSKLWSAETMYKRTTIVNKTNSNTWKTATITVVDASFAGNQNGGADFRFSIYNNQPLLIQEITITKVK